MSIFFFDLDFQNVSICLSGWRMLQLRTKKLDLELHARIDGLFFCRKHRAWLHARRVIRELMLSSEIADSRSTTR